MPKISLCLWFDNQAEEAAKFYTDICKNSKILEISRYKVFHRVRPSNFTSFVLFS